MKGVNMEVLWSEFGLHMKAVIHVCSSGPGALCVMAGLRLCEEKLMVGQTARHTRVLSGPLSMQMWAIRWLEPARCWSKPVNLIPISGSLIMCLPVLAFVGKRNEEMEKSKEREPKRGVKKVQKVEREKGGQVAMGLFREVIWQQKT